MEPDIKMEYLKLSYINQRRDHPSEPLSKKKRDRKYCWNTLHNEKDTASKAKEGYRIYSIKNKNVNNMYASQQWMAQHNMCRDWEMEHLCINNKQITWKRMCSSRWYLISKQGLPVIETTIVQRQSKYTRKHFHKGGRKSTVHRYIERPEIY